MSDEKSDWLGRLVDAASPRDGETRDEHHRRLERAVRDVIGWPNDDAKASAETVAHYRHARHPRLRYIWHRLRGHNAYWLDWNGACNTCDLDFAPMGPRPRLGRRR